ncbi:MAG: bestrophin-like domain [Limisphaerales bacterium]
MKYPFLIFLIALVVFGLASVIGYRLRERAHRLEENSLDDFRFVLGATLTLLGLVIGFTFSMAVTRYDQRKNYEEEEANAIGTEYVRADLLPSADAANVRQLLTEYLGTRIKDYRTRDLNVLRQLNTRTAQLQSRMWSAVTAPALAQPTPVRALVVSGMNDVLNSQGYTQAAWRNRIPTEAWWLMAAISVFCNLMIGYGAQGRSRYLLLILPFVLSIALFLIADIDSPRRGLIHVRPQNLESLAESFPQPSH